MYDNIYKELLIKNDISIQYYLSFIYSEKSFMRIN